ncbi:MAG: hypothetical protein KG012_09405 [Deltaproteobacteria bacterium]|nr:hypothetical protein [Deltaproteobacteria bacterium]
MVDVNLTAIFGEVFQDADALKAMAKVLSRQPESIRDRIINELALATNITGKAWRDRMRALTSKR